MKVRGVPVPKQIGRAECCAVFRFEGSPPNPGKLITAEIRAAGATGDLASEFRTTRLFHPTGSASPRRLVTVGMGAREDLDTDRLRRGAALAQARAESIECRKLTLLVEKRDHRGLDAFAAGQAIAEGLVLGAYRYQPPAKSEPKPRRAQRADVIYTGPDPKEFRSGLGHGAEVAAAVCFARDLENLPGNIATPTYLADRAKRLHGTAVKVRILDEREMKRLKFGALLGVSRGSAEPAKLIVLDYNPRGSNGTVCVVGKGLTFDSGGISIKPSAKMDEMRYDMCGGGAVLGLFDAIKRGALSGSGSKARIIGLVAAAENMPSSTAQKPGDVVTACDGTTIEVLNTDAEGRLVLADAIAYAIKTYQPDCVVDLATLTGAVVVALGHEIAGVMGNDDELLEQLIDAGYAADEPLWELPLWDLHRDQVKSRFADIQNINSPGQGGGSICGGAFLAKFAGDTPWAHLDIAGTAWGAAAKDYYRHGATGTGVRMLIQWLRART